MSRQINHYRKSKYGKVFIAGSKMKTLDLVKVSKENELLLQELDERFYSSKRHYFPDR